MAAVVAPSNIRALPTEVHTEDLDPMKPGGHQQFWYTVLGLGLAVGAFFTAWHGSASSTYRIDNQWSAMTGLFILALAIERALEPFSRKLGPDATKRKVRKDEALAGSRKDGRKDRAPEFDNAIEISRRLTAVVTWGVATGLGFLLCAVLNITLMQAVRANSSGQPPFWADLLVTGLVVGAGTKPLHDLVANIERGKGGKDSKNSKRDSR
jgi:FtsH-binding integral membrane protein